MENASKAILIAGGILIVLMLISVAVIIFNNSKLSVLTIEKRRVQKLIDQQTIDFAEYVGSISGSEVQNCIRKVVSHNENNPNYIITVILELEDEEKTFTNMSQIINDNENGINILPEDRLNLYDGRLITREDGTIENIIFREQFIREISDILIQ